MKKELSFEIDKQTAKSKRYHEKRTGEVLRAYRMGLIDAKKTASGKKVVQ